MPRSYKFEIDHPGERPAGIRSYSDEVTVIVDSGDPGGVEEGEDSFRQHMRRALEEWYEGAHVAPVFNKEERDEEVV